MFVLLVGMVGCESRHSSEAFFWGNSASQKWRASGLFEIPFSSPIGVRFCGIKLFLMGTEGSRMIVINGGEKEKSPDTTPGFFNNTVFSVGSQIGRAHV